MYTQTPRRHACDRCREQKLRCPRTQQHQGPCDRCLRLGARCFTSPGRPLGRPPCIANRSGPQQVLGDDGIVHEQRSNRSNCRASSDPMTAADLTPPDSLSALTSAPTMATKTNAKNMHVAASQDMMLQLCGYGMFINNAEMPPTANLDTFAPQLANDSDDAGRLSMDGLEHGWAASEADNEDSPREDNPASIAYPESDATASMIGIMACISRQLAELRSHPWETNIPRVALFDGMDNYYTSPWSFNPLERVFYATVKFVTVLQMMAPMDYLTAAPPCRPTTLPTALMLLSTYVQLGEIFELVLTRIYSLLQTKSRQESLEPTLSEIPGLGTEQPSSALPGRGQIRMLLHTIEHQLHLTENLLGLPADCRLWSKKGTSVGILDQEGTGILSDAALHQIHETFRSLKRSIKRIYSVL